VNSWVGAQAVEKAGSTLPHIQRSVGYLTRGQVLMPASALLDEVAEEQVPPSSPPLPVYPSPFLTVAMHSLPAPGPDLTIPHPL
jgi:hypothetical protein